MVNTAAEVVEVKVSESVCFRVMKECTVTALVSQAVRIPPLVPPTSTQWNWRKEVGRKERALVTEVEESFVSCRQIIVGLTVVSVSLTKYHIFQHHPDRGHSKRSYETHDRLHSSGCVEHPGNRGHHELFLPSQESRVQTDETNTHGVAIELDNKYQQTERRVAHAHGD